MMRNSIFPYGTDYAPWHVKNGVITPESFNFKSESLRNLSAAVATVTYNSIVFDFSLTEYRDNIRRIFSECKISEDDYKADGYKDFQDFARRVFGLPKSCLSDYI